MYLILLICLLPVFLAIIHAYRTQSRALARLRQQAQHNDTLLDYVLRYYSLHVADPFVALPGFHEKRCHHCHYPMTEGHAPACIWQAVQPVARKLYSETKAKALNSDGT